MIISHLHSIEALSSPFLGQGGYKKCLNICGSGLPSTLASFIPESVKPASLNQGACPNMSNLYCANKHSHFAYLCITFLQHISIHFLQCRTCTVLVPLPVCLAIIKPRGPSSWRSTRRRHRDSMRLLSLVYHTSIYTNKILKQVVKLRNMM